MTTLVPKTGNWCIAYRGSHVVPSAGHYNYLGLMNYASSRDIIFGGFGGASTTKWLLQVDGASTATNLSATDVDTSVHDFAIIGSAGTVNVWLDSTTNINTLATTVLSADEPMGLFLTNEVLGEMGVDKMIIGYVAR